MDRKRTQPWNRHVLKLYPQSADPKDQTECSSLVRQRQKATSHQGMYDRTLYIGLVCTVLFLLHASMMRRSWFCRKKVKALLLQAKREAPGFFTRWLYVMPAKVTHGLFLNSKWVRVVSRTTPVLRHPIKNNTILQQQAKGKSANRCLSMLIFLTISYFTSHQRLSDFHEWDYQVSGQMWIKLTNESFDRWQYNILFDMLNQYCYVNKRYDSC